jgi:class 3 adenylate cyclase
VEAERRQITVLFADMVSFTSFSEQSGEEAAYTLMRSLSKLMDEAVREQSGVVEALPATASWPSLVPPWRLRTRRFERVARR